MQPARALHRHQSSLEGIINFSERPPLTPTERTSASRRFYLLVNHFDTGASKGQYDRVKLVRFTFEYARSEESKGNLLRAFFDIVELPLEADSDEDRDIDLTDKAQLALLHESIFGFADYLFENFFLPVKASTRKTPQPSPASRSAIQKAQGQEYNFAGTPERVSALRGACLVRDRYRCVVSRKFDRAEAIRRRDPQGNEPRDEDGNPLRGQSFDALEVAHILPHSLTQVNSKRQLDPSREAALAILNMFDSGAGFMIEGTNIDRPRNALTLTPSLHQMFGDFQVFFEPVSQQPHTYRIDTFLDYWLLEDLLPATRTLYLTESRTIDPPSARLLAIHNAIAHILHLSAAGDYIDKIFRDLEEHGVRQDGSTELASFVSLRLNGWSVGEVSG
ncbi:hypothetical protein FZEAL_6552 [Fusarium zealandicum]|uniref:HNH nuclease domain-containing protein n=1 Tax=Fusarium zealandicum TaxID=1053134 RepID=A0A8H4UI40_9HYPO|nr:hypothetical protein FZEAL_6552 [Fusarium zealandicum]